MAPMAASSSTNQALPKLRRVQSVDGRNNQAAWILPVDNVLARPEGRNGRADWQDPILHCFSIRSFPGFEVTAAAFSW